ncbi:MAG: DUF3108 domain-containing protein [Nitrospira bacterium HGW-Nitrospira-1]|nr:MAG: DUF3108 domain-containing protein [Nitrospira bacterium HGW-Nitrospira-1]
MVTEKNTKSVFCSLRKSKSRLNRAALLLSLAFFLFFLPDASAFNTPEKFIFDLTWAGVKAGTATLEIANFNGHAKIISTARSADWVSVFYTVDDRIESLLQGAQTPMLSGLPQSYRVKLREGSHRRDKEVIFDHTNLQATFIDHIGAEKNTYKIGEKTFDPLASFYYIRTLRLDVGKSVYVDIFDSKKLWNVEVQVLRKEKIKTNLGEFDTVVIKPMMRSEGIFNRKGDMYIWLTDDLKRIPVKMQTKAAVGSITATLVGGTF